MDRLTLSPATPLTPVKAITAASSALTTRCMSFLLVGSVHAQRNAPRAMQRVCRHLNSHPLHPWKRYSMCETKKQGRGPAFHHDARVPLSRSHATLRITRALRASLRLFRFLSFACLDLLHVVPAVVRGEIAASVVYIPVRSNLTAV